MGLKHLIAIEKWTCLLALVVLGAGMLLLGRHAAFSIAVGAAMMTLNAVVLRRVAQKLGGVLQKKPSVTVLLFNFKLVVLIALVFVALRYLHVEPIPFIVGISVLPFAIMIVAVQSSLGRGADHEETHG
ncbi:MAG TPA: ATP synthase subunit I [Polyangia bacterium]